jgi:hypothetical protein
MKYNTIREIPAILQVFQTFSKFENYDLKKIKELHKNAKGGMISNNGLGKHYLSLL